ncbi:conserved hypothetical protein [Trichinella spiralis]|uniref:hypothetical protein n=1 Tax=Trichinella spiralis TaxID=6334 RepID=UPI0001EFDA4E|nr:conserved hypothetical protein [Trichinella spiralis]
MLPLTECGKFLGDSYCALACRSDHFVEWADPSVRIDCSRVAKSLKISTKRCVQARSIHVAVLKFASCRGLVVGISYKKAHHHCHCHHHCSDMNMTEDTLRGKRSVDLFFYLIALSQLACAYVNYLKCMEKCVSLFGPIDQEQSNARVETVKRHRWEVE